MGVKTKKEIAIPFSQDYNFLLGFSHFYRLNTLILGQFPCFSGIFHIKPFDRPIFLNYPENLQLSILYPGIIKKKTKKILSLFEVDGSHAQDGAAGLV